MAKEERSFCEGIKKEGASRPFFLHLVLDVGDGRRGVHDVEQSFNVIDVVAVRDGALESLAEPSVSDVGEPVQHFGNLLSFRGISPFDIISISHTLYNVNRFFIKI